MLLSSLPVMSLMALVLNRVFLHHYVLYSSLMIWIFKSKTAFLITLIIYNAIWVLSTLYLQKKVSHKIKLCFLSALMASLGYFVLFTAFNWDGFIPYVYYLNP